jgi:hypothetical protein
MRGKLAELKTLAESVQGDIHDSIAVNAETQAGGKVKAPPAAASPATPVNPFKLGN